MALRKDKRDAILEAAVREFRRVGYRSARMDDIAARARVSKRTVYNHFSSKELLFQEISSKFTERVIGAMALRFDSQKSLQEQMEYLAHRYIEVVSDQNFMGLARLVLREKMGQPGLASEKFERIRRGENGLADWIREASEHGAFHSSNPNRDARRFGALLAEFAFWPQLFAGVGPPSGEEREKAVKETVEFFLRARGVE